MLKKIYWFFFDSTKRFIFLSEMGFFNRMSDEKWIKILYKKIFKRDINLDDPQSFNEKLQWLKLYNLNPDYKVMVDKYDVKEYVSNIIGSEYIIPTIGLYDCWDDINIQDLPRKFVIKCTHDSGSTIICYDKNVFNFKKAKRKINKCLRKNFYYFSREWPYKDLKHRIIIEPLLIDNNSKILNDYKFLCFNGEPKLVEVHRNRKTSDYTQDFYDINWNKTSISNVGDPLSNIVIDKPINFDKMLEFSKVLSKGIPHIRVDWYEVNGQLFFGELTFFDGAGFVPYDDFQNDLLLGSWIELPEKNINR